MLLVPSHSYTLTGSPKTKTQKAKNWICWIIQDIGARVGFRDSRLLTVVQTAHADHQGLAACPLVYEGTATGVVSQHYTVLAFCCLCSQLWPCETHVTRYNSRLHVIYSWCAMRHCSAHGIYRMLATNYSNIAGKSKAVNAHTTSLCWKTLRLLLLVLSLWRLHVTGMSHHRADKGHVIKANKTTSRTSTSLSGGFTSLQHLRMCSMLGFASHLMRCCCKQEEQKTQLAGLVNPSWDPHSALWGQGA